MILAISHLFASNLFNNLQLSLLNVYESNARQNSVNLNK